jgi:hypothetical protein
MPGDPVMPIRATGDLTRPPREFIACMLLPAMCANERTVQRKWQLHFLEGVVHTTSRAIHSKKARMARMCNETWG